MGTWPTHIGVDQQHPLASLGEADRDVPGNHRLTFTRTGARHHDRPWAAVCRREQDVGAQRTKRFGKVGGALSLISGLARAPIRGQHRNQPERRDAELAFDFLWRLHAVIQVLEEEREADAEECAAEESTEDVQQRGAG